MKRILTFILSVVVLLTSLLPCSDAAAKSFSSLVKTEFTKPTPAEGSRHSDNCPPFCHCSCCSISVSQPSVLVFSEPFQAISITTYGEYVSPIFEMSFPVWEPPQLS